VTALRASGAIVRQSLRNPARVDKKRALRLEKFFKIFDIVAGSAAELFG